MLFSNRCSRLVVVIALWALQCVPAVSDEASKLDPRAEMLLAAFKAMSDNRPDAGAWQADQGPWAPYLKESMTAALGEREQRLYETAMRLGDCQSVISLQSAGFVLAHPFLQAAHAKPLVGEMFVDTVVRKSLDSRYCLWRRELNDALANLAKLEIANVLPVRLESAHRLDLGQVEYDSRARSLVHSVCEALWLIAGLAVHDDYRRAIKSLVNLNVETNVAHLPPAAEVYLIERANALGIDAHAGKERLDAIHHKLTLSERMAIKRYARDRKGPLLSRLTWHCPKPPRDARKPNILPFWLQQ